MSPKPSNAAIAVEILRRVEIKIDQHIADDAKMFHEIRESLDGCDEYPGLRGRISHLENRMTDTDVSNLKTFKTQVKTIGSVLAGIVGFLGWDWLHNFFTITVIQGSK